MNRKLLIAGTSSRSGKTTVTCALLAALRHRGFSLSAYKTGPDYIDTEYLRRSGKCRAFNLDTWLMSKENVQKLFALTSSGNDISVIEGAMGLYDGGTQSTAETAKLIDAPVVLVVNAKSSGESIAATVLGFSEYDTNVKIAGVILNMTGSDYHAEIIADALRAKGIKFLGALRRDDEAFIPERHLGLVSAFENDNFDAEKLRVKFESSVDVDELLRIAEDTNAVAGDSQQKIFPSTKKFNVKIAVAGDEAFVFRYEESMMMLKAWGAEIIPFSPLNDVELPTADGYIFGGGYPEIFADRLAANSTMLRSVKDCRKPMLAECGGMMYLCRSLRNIEGVKFKMTGVIPFDAFMGKRSVLGYMEATALRDNLLCRKGERIRGHEFHYAGIEPEVPTENTAFRMIRRNRNETRLSGYVQGNLLASWLHVNFFGNEKITRNFLNVLTSSRVQ